MSLRPDPHPDPRRGTVNDCRRAGAGRDAERAAAPEPGPRPATRGRDTRSPLGGFARRDSSRTVFRDGDSGVSPGDTVVRPADR